MKSRRRRVELVETDGKILDLSPARPKILKAAR